MAKKEQPKTLDIFVQGASNAEAEGALAERVSQYKTDLKVDLKDEVAREYTVLLYKGESKKAALHASGKTFAEAIGVAQKEFGVNAADFNQLVRIIATYALTKEEAKKVAQAVPPSAGPVSSHKSATTYFA